MSFMDSPQCGGSGHQSYLYTASCFLFSCAWHSAEKPRLWWRPGGEWDAGWGEEALIVSCKNLKRLTIASKTRCHKNWPTSCSIKRQLKNTDTDPGVDTQWHDMTGNTKENCCNFIRSDFIDRIETFIFYFSDVLILDDFDIINWCVCSVFQEAWFEI